MIIYSCCCWSRSGFSGDQLCRRFLPVVAIMFTDMHAENARFMSGTKAKLYFLSSEVVE